MKQNTRSSSGISSRPRKKIRVQPEEKRPVRAKPDRVRIKGISRKDVELVRNEARDLSEEDLKDFDTYQHYHGFLQNLDPQALAQKVSRQSRVSEKGKISHNESPRPTETVAQARSRPLSQYDTAEIESSTSSSFSDVETASNASFDSDLEDVVSDSTVQSESSNNQNSVPRSKYSKRSIQASDYEMHGRAFQSSSASKFDSERLPIKLSDGTIRTLPRERKDVPTAIEKSVEAHDNSQYSASQAETDPRPLPPTVFASDSPTLRIKESLAQLAMEIIEDPEENVAKLGTLREIMTRGPVHEQQLTMLTLSAVFKDIIPGYRVRPLSEVEKAEKVTKEVRHLRTFEQTLVAQYKEFVMSLVAAARTSRKTVLPSDAESALRKTAVSAACSLIQRVPHFNFRTELLNIIIGQISRKHIDETFIMCRGVIEELFRDDEEGEASYECMRILCKKIKDRGYQVDASTVSTFLHLRLLTEMESRGSTQRIDRSKLKKKDKQFRSKSLRKLMKDQKEVEKDMREAEATVDDETRERLQGDTLKLAFTTYFRILKDKENYSLVGAALEGLARFASLINVDFFGDLLEVLKELMLTDPSNGFDLSTRDTLLCIITAFTLLSGQAATKETIGLDLSKFMDKLYACMLSLAINPNVQTPGEFSSHQDDVAGSASSIIKHKVNVATESEMLLRALDVVFFKHRAQGASRLTAFVKRLSISSLHFPEKSSAACLELTKRLAARYDKLYAMFSTEESAGDGHYNGFTDKLELSNPSATSIWEMALFRKHFSPRVRQASLALLETLQASVDTKK